MYNYCIFLRGVNLNGRKIKMDELKEVISSLGFNQVKTLLATGNILINADEKPDQAIIEKKLKEYYDFEVHIHILDKEALEKFIKLNPSVDERNHYALLINNISLIQELIEIFNKLNQDEGEELIYSDSTVIWIVNKGMTLKTEFGKKVLGSQKYKNKLTSRNMSTIHKVYNLLET